MKANRAPRRRADEAGLSNVLGAILLFGLFVLTMVTIQVKFVPRWDEDREAKSADLLSSQLAQLKADMDRQATNGTSTPITDPLTLRKDGGFRLFRSPALGGTTSFVSQPGNAFQFSAPQITIQESEGVPLFGITDPASSFQAFNINGGTQGPMDVVRHMRVQIDNPSGLSTPRSSAVEIRDVNNAFAGRIVFRLGSDAVFVETYNSANTLVTTRLDDIDPDGPDFYFNLLDDNLLWGAVLEAATGPFTLVFTETSPSLNAQYNIVYDRTTAGGVERVGGDIGLTQTSYLASAAGGALRVTVPNQRFPAQDYILEHGAIIRVQPDGAALIVPPSFSVTRTAAQARIVWALPTLQGDDGGVGSREVSATLSPTGTAISVSAFAPSFTVTLGTNHPTLWRDFWLERLQGSGFLSNEYLLATTASTASITVYGPTAAPASTANDLLLDIRQSKIDLDLRSSG